MATALPPALPLAGLVALAPISALGEVVAPSGQIVTLQEVLTEQNPWSGETQIVVRLLAPMIADDSLSDDLIRSDMEWACGVWGQSAASQPDRKVEWVVIEMMAATASRGTATPDIRRFYETYRLDGDLCIWELF